MIEQNMGVTCKELFTAIKEYAEIVGVTIGTQKDETRRYACGPIPVDVTLPEGEHDKDILRDSWGLDGSHYFAPIEEEISYINKIGSKYCRNDRKN